MKKIRFLFIVVLFTVDCSLCTGPFASSVDDVVAGMEKKYSVIRDMKGSFSQTSFLKDLEKTERYEGEFFIKKPAFLRWKYSKPRDEEVIIRNTETWIYRKSEKQAFKTIVSKADYSQVPVSLLGSLDALKKNFDITLVKEGTLGLTPRRTMGYIKSIHVDVDPGAFPVKTLTILDVYNNRVILEIRGVKVNTGIEDSFFVFTVPPGVEVFDLGE